MRDFKDIAYIRDNDKGHMLDIYLPDAAEIGTAQSTTQIPLIIYVHGGAWRADDKSTVAYIGPGLLEATDGRVAVALVNYRLSTRNPDSVRHPDHLNDVRAAVEFLITNQEYPGSELIDKNNVFLVGHSAGAHLAMMTVLDNCEQQKKWLGSIKGVFGIGGIYDIPALLEQYPSYSDFVGMAFSQEQYAAASPLTIASRGCSNKISEHMRFMVVNSTKDELIDPRQSVLFVQQLVQAGYGNVNMTVCDLGDHYGELERKEFWQM
ncbi:hypothetical protein FB639_006544, partial [Coemansia asiatica]